MKKIVLVISSLLIASAMLCNINNAKVKQIKQNQKIKYDNTISNALYKAKKLGWTVRKFDNVNLYTLVKGNMYMELNTNDTISQMYNSLQDYYNNNPKDTEVKELLYCFDNQIKNDYYPMTTIVREIDNKNDIVTVENNNGELFQFTGIEDWQINDICSLMLDNNGTENIYDDIIIKTIYDGKIN